jgi:hypothetical protein
LPADWAVCGLFLAVQHAPEEQKNLSEDFVPLMPKKIGWRGDTRRGSIWHRLITVPRQQ